MTLLPKSPGLRLEDTFIDVDTVSLSLASTTLPVTCPVCAQETARLHSHYGRTVADLPWSGRRVRLFLNVRKFRCPQQRCPRKIFTERLPDLVESYARKTVRLHEILELVSFALGGEAGARLIRRLGMIASPSTLLRYVKRAAAAPRRDPHITRVNTIAGILYGRGLASIEHCMQERAGAALEDYCRGSYKSSSSEEAGVRSQW